jgi:hypothetical protein
LRRGAADVRRPHGCALPIGDTVADATRAAAAAAIGVAL